MGNISNNRPQTDSFDSNQWMEIVNYSYTNNQDPYYGSNFVVFKNKKRPNEQLQRYQLYFNSITQYKSYYQSFIWRTKHSFLVNAKYCQEREKKYICSTFHQASIYLQRIPIRVCQITETPIDEGLYIIYSSIQGYKKIYQKTGYFQVRSDMIGINKQSKVKVWPNINFSKNFPEFNSMNQNKSEGDFIMNLIQVCQNTIDLSGVLSFSHYLKQSLSKQMLKRLCFDEALIQLQFYVKSQKLVIARQMKSIRQLFRNKNNNKKQIIVKQANVRQSNSNQALKTYEFQQSGEMLYKQDPNSSPNYLRHNLELHNQKQKQKQDKTFIHQDKRVANIQAFDHKKNMDINYNDSQNINISPLMLSPSDSIQKLNCFVNRRDKFKQQFINTKRKRNVSKYFNLRQQITDRSNGNEISHYNQKNSHSQYFAPVDSNLQEKHRRRGPSVSFMYQSNSNNYCLNQYFSPQNSQAKVNEYQIKKNSSNSPQHFFLKPLILPRQRAVSSNFPKNLYVEQNDFAIKNQQAFKKQSPNKKAFHAQNAKNIQKQSQSIQKHLTNNISQNKTYYTLNDKCQIDKDIAIDLKRFQSFLANQK